MSKNNQFNTMVNYFNSLLSEPTTPQENTEQTGSESLHSELNTVEQQAQTMVTDNKNTAKEPVVSAKSSSVPTSNEVRKQSTNTSVPGNNIVLPKKREVAFKVEEKETTRTNPALALLEPIVTMPQDIVTSWFATPQTTETIPVEASVKTPPRPTPQENNSEPNMPTDTNQWKNLELPEDFNALFFKVGTLTLAVPLQFLGGIYEPGKITPLEGKPAWYLGIIHLHEQQIAVVDTFKWLKPTSALVAHTYPFIIILGQSTWCIGCDEIIGTKILQKSAVKWRTNAGARPWLAGIVKDEMCALLHVDELQKMLNYGLNIENQ